MKLVFIGIQGSGKGTQARKLKEECGFEIFETGQVLRDISKQNNELGILVKQTIDAGKQVTPNVIEDILKDYLSKTDNEKIIFDGLVRNEGHKKIADKIIKDYKVISFDLSEKEAIKRLLGRMYNPKTGETFTAGTTKDPNTGDKLIKRLDDEEKIIRTRIEQFFTKTMPVVEIYNKEGKIIHINADQSIEKVLKDIKNKLGLEKFN